MGGGVPSFAVVVPGAGLDVALFRWINEHRHPILDWTLGPVSALGEMSVLWLLVCAVMFFFGRQEHKRAGLVLLLAMLILDGLVGALIKGVWERQRPYLALTAVNTWGVAWRNSSFPSGHAYSSVLAAVILGAKFRRALLPLAGFAALTCYSRPYLGMHYPSDVLAGAILGVIAGFVALRVERAWEGGRNTAQPAWWSVPSTWSVVFSALGLVTILAGVKGFGTQPLGFLAAGFILGLGGVRRVRRRRWLAVVGAAMALLGLVVLVLWPTHN